MGIFTVLFLIVASIGLYGFATAIAIRRDPTRRTLRIMGALGGLIGSGLWLGLLAIANYLLLSTGLVRILTLEVFVPDKSDLIGRVLLGIKGTAVTPFFAAAFVISSFAGAYFMLGSARRAVQTFMARPPLWGLELLKSLTLFTLGASITACDVYLLSFRITTMVYTDLIEGAPGELPSLAHMPAPVAVAAPPAPDQEPAIRNGHVPPGPGVVRRIPRNPRGN